jgi:hypothetical protein
MTEKTSRLIDLDAAKEARAATLGEPPGLKWKGQTYALPPELPARFLDAIAVDDYDRAFAVLFDGSGFDVDAFLDESVYGDLAEFAEGITRVYGLEGGLGNLRASGASSSITSRS